MSHANMQIGKVLYTAKAQTTGGQEAEATCTSDCPLDVQLTALGTKSDRTNPEQLLAMGWSSCFLSAIKIVAARMKVKLPRNVAVGAEVDLGTTDGQYSIQARLNVSLPGIDRETAQRLVDGAHGVCPYSKATHGNIKVVTNLIDADNPQRDPVPELSGSSAQ
jgi:lipoyl-dependent peroxiredoxin